VEDKVHLDLLAYQVLKEVMVSEAQKENEDHLVFKECLEWRVPKDPQVLMDLQDHKAQLAPMVHLVIEVHLVYLDQQVQLDQEDLKVPKVSVETLVNLEKKDHLDQLVYLVLLVLLVQEVKEERKVLQENQDPLDLEEDLETRDPPDLLV